MNCKEVRLFIPLFVLGGQEMTLDEWFALDDHIQSCSRCAKEYEETKFIVELVEHHRTNLINKSIFSELVVEEAIRELPDEENLQEIWDRVKRSEARRRHNKNVKKAKQFLKASAAVAACLVIGVLTWMVFPNFSKPPTLPQDSSTQQIASVLKPSVRIEPVKPSVNIALDIDQAIVAENELKTLLINGKHQMTMNYNTILTVEPLVKKNNIGCLVKLDSGQIYTHVQHDGNPFIVVSAHGQALITGTTFDIKATKDSTKLVVAEGTVCFESKKGIVNVAAGQKSEMVGQSAPSIPLSCNTDELTAWATGYKAGPALAKTELNPDPWDLPLAFGEKPIVLVETDYSQWVEQKREWFKLAFPWIFQLKEALTKVGIEVDYPELLISTGDVWQFVYLDEIPSRFSVIDPNSLLKAVSDYGLDKLWLLENVPIAKSALKKPVLSKNSSASLKAFERWLDCLNETKGLMPLTPIYSYHASKYLANTRSLIWFAVRDGKYDFTDEDCTEVLVLLQKEVTVACQCQNANMYPTDKQEKPFCDDVFTKADKKIIGFIETMKAVENKITEYNKSKLGHY